MPFRMATLICLLDTYSVVSAPISLQQVNGNECDPSRLFSFISISFRISPSISLFCIEHAREQSSHIDQR